MWLTFLLLRSDKPLHGDRGRDTDREGGRKRSRSRSRSKDRDGETNPKRRRKRVSRWSDRPPSPHRDDNRNDNSRDADRWRDRLVDRPPPDEPVVGDIYNGKISSIMQFGCFVQLEGLRLVSYMWSLQPWTPIQHEMVLLFVRISLLLVCLVAYI